MSENQKEQNNTIKRVKKEIDELLRKNGAMLRSRVEFPIYRKLPIELELALQVMQKHEPTYAIEVIIEKTEQLHPTEQEKKSEEQPQITSQEEEKTE